MADGHYNEIRNIRPGSTFANYKAQTPEQEQALAQFESIADNLIQMASGFGAGVNPMDHAAMFVAVGRPGTGKSHLLEALVNKIAKEAPDLLDSMFLLRRDFTTQMYSGSNPTDCFAKKSIILIDDLFSDHHSVKTLSPIRDVPNMMRFIMNAYEQRTFVIATSNFPFMSGILTVIQANDPVGRTYSRCREMLTAYAGEMEITGPDYREVLAQKALEQKQQGGKTPFTVPGFGKKPK